MSKRARLSDVMTTAQVAKLFHIHPKTVAQRVKRRELPAPIAVKPTLFLRDAVERVMGKRK